MLNLHNRKKATMLLLNSHKKKSITSLLEKESIGALPKVVASLWNVRGALENYLLCLLFLKEEAYFISDNYQALSDRWQFPVSLFFLRVFD